MAYSDYKFGHNSKIQVLFREFLLGCKLGEALNMPKTVTHFYIFFSFPNIFK